MKKSDRFLAAARRCLALMALACFTGTAFAQTTESAPLATSEDKPAGKMITLSDFGAEDLGYLALPEEAPIGGVVVIHDRWGLDDNTKKLADMLASHGFLALAVDMYNGRTVNDVVQANVLLANLRLQSALKTIEAGVRLLKESPRLKVDRVALVGYSSGGTVALMQGQQYKEVDAVAALDGVIAPRTKEMSKYRVPICLVFPKQKKGEEPIGLTDLEKLMKDMSNPLETHYIDSGEYGFDDPRHANYDAAAAAKGWAIIETFLKRELSKPAQPPSLIDKMGNIFKSGN